MPTESAALTDEINCIVTPDLAVPIPVPGEQLVAAEGVSGPDPDQWDDVDARSEPGHVTTEEGQHKGPSEREWGAAAREERGAHPADNPRPSETMEITTDDVADLSNLLGG